MKRVVSVFAAICMLLAVLPAAITAETYEDLTYTVFNGKVTITDCAESVAGGLEIPATIAGYPVTTIGISAFADCAGLTAVTLGENVTTLGDYAFSGCTGLTAIDLTAKVTSVGAGAFSGCTALTAITVAEGNPVYHSAGNSLIETSSKTLVAGCKASQIPADGTVTAIGKMAFYNCAGLTAVTLPDTILSVGASAFEKCADLAQLSLGNVTAIGNSAFLGCTALTQVTLPDSLTSLGVFAFNGCTGLESVTFGAQLATVGNSTFSGCTALTDVDFGGLQTIDLFAFSGCTALTDIVIGNSVTTIGKFAFYNCGLLDVQIPENVTAIGDNAFAACEDICLTINENNAYAIAYAQENNIDYKTVGLDSLAVTTVSLRPSVAGVYFGSNLDWAAKDSSVASYGIVVSLENTQPVADGSDASCLYTQGNTSVMISNIMGDDYSAEENSKNAMTLIYARAYIQLDDGEYIYSDAVRVNLRQVVLGANNQWDELTATQQESLSQMYEKYQSIMRFWNLTNLNAA